MDTVDVDAVTQDIQRLSHLLEQEFEALKSRQIDVVNALEQEKMDVLSRLQSHSERFASADEISAQWVTARDDLRVCRDMHFRNIQLLRRQLDAVQGALQTLIGESEWPLPIYDRTGQVSRLSGVRAYQAA